MDIEIVLQPPVNTAIHYNYVISFYITTSKDRPGMEGKESRRSCSWKTPCTSQTGYICLRSGFRDRLFPHTLTL